MENKELAACLNYEAEYYRMMDEHKKLCATLHDLKQDYQSMETEFARMRAQLDIVYLIFGGK